MQTAARRPIRFRPWASPTVVVLLPSPSGVGVIPVTTTYLPRALAASSRSIPARVTLALAGPYSSTSSSRSPSSRASSTIGRGRTDRAISRSEGNAGVLVLGGSGAGGGRGSGGTRPDPPAAAPGSDGPRLGRWPPGGDA